MPPCHTLVGIYGVYIASWPAPAACEQTVRHGWCGSVRTSERDIKDSSVWGAERCRFSLRINPSPARKPLS